MSEQNWYKHPVIESTRKTARIRHLYSNLQPVNTYATIRLTDGRVAVGVAECGPKDQFIRARGRMIALNRALYQAATTVGLAKVRPMRESAKSSPYQQPRVNAAILSEHQLVAFESLVDLNPFGPLAALNTVLNMSDPLKCVETIAA